MRSEGTAAAPAAARSRSQAESAGASRGDGHARVGDRPFDRVLVANRGEIAVRVIRTLQRLGIHAIAVYSDADRDAPHVALADTAVRIGPAPALESYLDAGRVVAAAVAAGAEAVHPGYGFLSEDAGFAAACAEAGLVFVGPGAHALEVMGDKVRAKAHVAREGVPVVPGAADAGADDAPAGLDLDPDASDRDRRDQELVAAADDVGYPLLVKPSAGGGGKGMQVVRDRADLAAAIPAARRVAAAAFGDDTLLVERLIERPRHIEVQVLADAHGHVVHLGERECSLQRRHQKVIEEAPSPLLDAATRDRIGAAACAAARSVGYLGAGTVEFLVSDASPDEFFFIEMNTRLQVEHPVTELVTGIDLVEAQLRIAAGEPLPFAQADVRLDGHAIEARVYAESPARGFLPATGEVLAWREPDGPGIRVDAGIRVGQAITGDYDPMLAKAIAHGASRGEALKRLDRALADTVVLGVETNVGFLRRLLADPAVRAGDLHTGLIQDVLDREAEGPRAEPPAGMLATVAEAFEAADAPPSRAHAWERLRGWRTGGTSPAVFPVEPVAGSFPATGPISASTGAAIDGGRVVDRGASVAVAADGIAWVHLDGETAAFRRLDRRAVLEARLARDERGGGADPDLRAPMPGTVTAVLVADGASVEAGDPVVAVEAMKMEHRVTAACAGIVRLAVEPGARVARDDVVARIVPHAAPGVGASETSAPAHEAVAGK